MNAEEIVARSFLEASKLTPEQIGMLKFWRCIMKNIDAAEEAENGGRTQGSFPTGRRTALLRRGGSPPFRRKGALPTGAY